MDKINYNLLVTAHPDDESIFFAGVVLRKRKLTWKLICISDGNADGRGKERAHELCTAARILGIRDLEQWNYPDIYEKRFPVDELIKKLQSLEGRPKEIFTHGPLGEYGHPHHQDVCMAVHLAFPRAPIYSPAYNAVADLNVILKPTEWKKKQKIYGEIYKKETLRFTEALPLNAVESFARFRLGEVRALYEFFTGVAGLKVSALKKYHWLREHLVEIRERQKKRVF